MRFAGGIKQDGVETLLSFEISAREEALLLEVLRMYPVLEDSHHRIRREGGEAGSDEQRVLEEAMAQLRESHQQKLEELLGAPERIFKDGAGRRRMVLTGQQLEWLLQVLNDIRVGSWVRLGCPDPEQTRDVKAGDANARDVAAMHISGGFQAVLLEAVQ
jgi:hypothetical protein